MISDDDVVSEVALEAAIRASGGVGFWTWNIKDDIAQADAVSALLFNLAPSQSRQGVSISVLMKAVHPEDSERLSSTIMDRVETGGSYSTEYRVVSPTGKIRWLFTRGHFFLDTEGKPDRGRGVIVEITDTRKDTEAWIELDGETIDDPVNRAADYCLAAHNEISKIGNSKLLMTIEILLLDLGRLIADQQKSRNGGSVH